MTLFFEFLVWEGFDLFAACLVDMIKSIKEKKQSPLLGGVDVGMLTSPMQF